MKVIGTEKNLKKYDTAPAPDNFFPKVQNFFIDEKLPSYEYFLSHTAAPTWAVLDLDLFYAIILFKACLNSWGVLCTFYYDLQYFFAKPE